MKKITITKEDKKAFNNTINGANKYMWCKIGGITDFIATFGISLLIIYSYIFSFLSFYIILYSLLVVIILGGEFIGTYYGALEQFVLHRKEKKELSIGEGVDF